MAVSNREGVAAIRRVPVTWSDCFWTVAVPKIRQVGWALLDRRSASDDVTGNANEVEMLEE
jgi:hypothetical protein